jgi:crotonobetainyl-CoA:carnitine CoA-transferase CaiB-like acyl-CoA transferase
MHDTARTVRRPTPDRGEHTDEILRAFGYSDAQLKALRASGAIA